MRRYKSLFLSAGGWANIWWEGRWWGWSLISDLVNCLLIVTLFNHGNNTKWTRKTEAVLEHLSTWAFLSINLNLNTWALEHLITWAIEPSVHFILNTMSGGEVGHDWRGPWTLDQGLFPRRTNLQVKYHYTRVMWKPSQVPLPICWHPQACQLGGPDYENQEEIMHWSNRCLLCPQHIYML